MTVDTWVQGGLTAVTAVGAALAGRAARRTRRQERRDDFTVVTNRMDKEIKRLETRQGEQQEQLTGQGAAISWLVVDRRGLVSYIRQAGLEPPAPRPIPHRARPYLEHIEV
jgi:membrane protein implicated in regulation of membrane protease activity